MFSREDARWLSETVAAVYAATSTHALAQAAMASMDRKFRLHSFACEELRGLDASSYRLHALRCGTPAPRDYQMCFHDNPLAWVLGTAAPPPVLHMRHDVPFSQWGRTDHYNGIARTMGWHDQMLIVASAAPRFVSVGAYRDRPFTDAERRLGALLQPHLKAAWMRVRPGFQDGDATLSLHVVLSGQCQPIMLSADVRAVLQIYFPGWRATSELPAPLRTWVLDSLSRLRAASPPAPLYALSWESVRGRLIARCFPRADGTTDLRMVEERAEPDYLLLRRCGLTERECEVLHWIARGKRDAEIALIIGAAPKTISKHVEHLLRKLGSETRGAAVSEARARLQAGSFGAYPPPRR